MRRYALVLGVLLAPAAAHANGAYSHVHMSQIAADALPPGELATLLAMPANRLALEQGSMFPDSGYAAGDEYGEITHWEPFLTAFIDQLRTTHGDDFSSAEAQRAVAFLLGVASHGLADQSYDTTLLARSFEVDGPENEAHPVDQYADYFIVVDEQVVFTVEAWAPFEAIVPSVAAVGHTVDQGTLMNGMSRMSAVIGIQSDPRIAGNNYWDAWEDYPFLGTHVYNPVAVGSLPWVARCIMAYWEVVWARLQGADDVDEQLVIHTVPEDGGVNWPVNLDASVAWGRPAIWFGYGIDRDQLAPRVHLRMTGTSEEVPFGLDTAYGGRDRNLVFVRPEGSLLHDTEYDIEIDPGVETLDGRTTTTPFVFSFRTRCAEGRLDACPPLDPPLVTGPLPERPTATDAGPSLSDAGMEPDAGGGCAVAPNRPTRRRWLPAALFSLAWWIANRRRRRFGREA